VLSLSKLKILQCYSEPKAKSPRVRSREILPLVPSRRSGIGRIYPPVDMLPGQALPGTELEIRMTEISNLY
jgi:hypothetical protein